VKLATQEFFLYTLQIEPVSMPFESQTENPKLVKNLVVW